jgi:hypothetical protein
MILEKALMSVEKQICIGKGRMKTPAYCLETSDLMKRKYQVGSIPSDWNILCLGSLANLSVTS